MVARKQSTGAGRLGRQAGRAGNLDRGWLGDRNHQFGTIRG